MLDIVIVTIYPATALLKDDKRIIIMPMSLTLP